MDPELKNIKKWGDDHLSKAKNQGNQGQKKADTNEQKEEFSWKKPSWWWLLIVLFGAIIIYGIWYLYQWMNKTDKISYPKQNEPIEEKKPETEFKINQQGNAVAGPVF